MQPEEDDGMRTNRDLLSKAFLLFALAGFVPAAMAAIETTPVREQTLPILRFLDARIEAVQQATVSAQTSGRVTEINVDVDDYVENGEVILRLRDNDQRAAFNAAKANYEEASSEYKRVKDIYQKKLVAKSTLDKAEARLKSTKAELEQAREALQHTVVRAPYSGIVVERHVEVGEIARVGQPLMTGLSLEQLRAVVELPQSVVHTVRRNKHAWVMVGKDLQQRLEVTDMRISPYADPKSHTFTVKMDLPQGDHQVYPGMYTKAGFAVGEAPRLSVPAEAIARRSEVTAVYVLDEEGRWHFRQVRTGNPLPDGQVEVLAGVNAGERVALDPVAAAVAIHQGVHPAAVKKQSQ